MKRLVLRFDGGPLAGREFRFSPASSRIVLGRARGAGVRWPDGTADIGSEHCELVRDAGRYELRVNRDDAVWIDAQRARDGQEIQPGARLAFGAERVHTAIAAYEEVSATRAFVAGLRSRGGAWMLAAIVAIGLAVVVGTRAPPALHTPIETVAAPGAQRDPAPPSWSPVVARVQPSVYLVLLRSPAGETAVGTAWVADADQLATNAHVALSIAQALQGNPDHRVVVRAGVPPFDEWPIIGVRIHPAFEPFASAVRAYAPMRVESDGAPRRVEISLGYDVALLRVPATARLAPPLTRASDDTLRALRPGEPVAYVGFPIERLLEADVAQPSARSQTGTIVSITNFTMTHATGGAGQRIEHSLPATGGASGSPIFNGRGEVIALLSGGNVIATEDGQRAPNAALVNFAQRVDLLAPLLAARPDETPRVDLDQLRADWQRDLGRYDTPEQAADKHIAQIAARWARAAGSTRPPPPFVTQRLEGPWQQLQGGRVVLRTMIALTAGRHLVAVVGDRSRELRGSAFLGGRARGEVIAQDMSDDYYPVLRLQLDHDDRVEIEIEDTGTSDASKAGPVELRRLSL